MSSTAPARIITGRPDRGAVITDHRLELPGRTLRLRVHRPVGDHQPLPLVVQFHGGGFVVGTPAQSDWLNSKIAARCQAVVVAVSYRLAPEDPLPAPLLDGHDMLEAVLRQADRWAIDPRRVAVIGESAGGTIAAMVAAGARDRGRPVLAQVLLYPCTDWTDKMFDVPSITRNADNPTLPVPLLRAFRNVALPAANDAAAMSPMHLADLTGLPATLVQVADLDPVADHGLQYAALLQRAGNSVQANTYARATHGFISTPTIVRAARPAADAVVEFLRGRLYPSMGH